jgi:glycosyltransferase involved in cell wall biosynthesis
VPPQPHHILSTYYRAADVVLVPSRSESFGLVALEASACGVPVVASAVGGLLTLVDHCDTGFLVPDRDPDVFAATRRARCSRPGCCAAMGARGCARARRVHVGVRRCATARGCTATSPCASSSHARERARDRRLRRRRARRSSADRRVARRLRRVNDAIEAVDRGRRREATTCAGTCGCAARRRSTHDLDDARVSARCATRRT